jgi:hypothetical protein
MSDLVARLRTVRPNVDIAMEAAAEIERLAAERDKLREALEGERAAHYATWMAARAEVEGYETSAALFAKEGSSIRTRAALKGRTDG